MTVDRLQTTTKVYIATLVIVAVCLVTASRSWASPQATNLPLALVLSACMVLAWLYPLHFTFKTKLYVDTAVITAAILLVEPSGAMLIAGAGTLLAHVIRRSGRDWPQAIFNTAQSMNVSAIGGLILVWAGWDPGQPAFSDLWPLLAVPVAAVAMQVVSTVGVTTVVALEARQSILDSWRQGFLDTPRIELPAQCSLFGIGMLAAIVADSHPWALVLLVSPMIAVYLTLQQQHQLRAEAERARLASEANLATTQRVAQLGNWEWNLVTGEQLWSAEAQRIVGFAAGATQSTPDALLRVVEEADRAAVDRAMEAARLEGAPLHVTYRIHAPGGTTRVVHQEAEVQTNEEGRAVRVVGTIQDVTERNSLEVQIAGFAERERVAQELARVRRRLAESREDERLRLARALHDGPVQDLLAISYQLAARQPLAAVGRRDAGRGTAPVTDDVRHDVLDVVGQLRTMIGELRPPGLTEFGVAAALEGYVAGLQRQGFGAMPEIFLDIASAANHLPSQQAISVFRIAQEALRNALRHAAADEVMLSLDVSDSWVRLEIHDDGRGFEVPRRMQTFADAGHFGLIGVAERVEQVGGTFAVASAPTAGTTISVRLPLVDSDECDG